MPIRRSGRTRGRESPSTACRSRLAGDELKCAAVIQVTRVIVNDHRRQATASRPGKHGQHKTCRSRLAGDGLRCAAFVQVIRVIVNDHRRQAGSYKRPRPIPGNTGNAIPVGAGLPAMDSSAPRSSRSHALSLTTIVSKRPRPVPGNTGNAIPVGAGLLAMDSSAPRLCRSYALSLTTIASKPAPTRDRVLSRVTRATQYLYEDAPLPFRFRAIALLATTHE